MANDLQSDEEVVLRNCVKVCLGEDWNEFVEVFWMEIMVESDL